MPEDHSTERRLLLRIAGKVDPSAKQAIEGQIKFMEELGAGLESVADKQKLVTDEMFKFVGKHFPEVWKAYVDEMKKAATEKEKLAGATKKLADAETKQEAAVAKDVSALKKLFDILGKVTVGVAALGTGLVAVAGIAVWKLMQQGWQTFKTIVTSGIKEIVSGLKEWAAYIVEINADMQQTVVSFEALLGSQERAAWFLKEVRDMAVSAGVSYSEMAASAKQLIPYARGDPEQFERMLKLMALLRAYKPEAGIAGAQLAIVQAMAGQYYTLARRFAIPRTVIKQWEEAGLRGLELMEAVLGQMGLGEELLEAQANTWKSLLVSIQDFAKTALQYLTGPAFDIFNDKLKEGVTWMRANAGQIDALAIALGKDLGGAVKELTDILFGTEGFNEDKIFQVIEWGAKLVAGLVEGLLWGANNVLIPALVQIGEIIAGFLRGTSPPKMGVLHTIDRWFGPVIRAYLSGFKASDFQVLGEIGRIIKISLATAVAGGDITKGDMTSRLLESRALIVRMVQELRAGGAIAAESWAELGNIIGMDVQLIQGYIDLVNRLKSAQAALTAAQNAYAAAMKVVRAIQEEIRLFELETAEIPERYKRGRRMELEFKLMAAQKESRIRQEQVKFAQAQVKEAQELLNAYKAMITQLGELANAALKAGEEEEELFGIMDGLFTGTGSLIEELKGKWLELYKSIHKAFEPVRDDFEFLMSFFKGLIGRELPPVPGTPFGEPRPMEEVPPGFEAGARLREAFAGIGDNVYKIGDALVGVIGGLDGVNDKLNELTDWYDNRAPQWLKNVLTTGEQIKLIIDFKMERDGQTFFESVMSLFNDIYNELKAQYPFLAWVGGVLEGLEIGPLIEEMKVTPVKEWFISFEATEGGEESAENWLTGFIKKLVEPRALPGAGLPGGPVIGPLAGLIPDAESSAKEVTDGITDVFTDAADGITKAVEEGVSLPMLDVFDEIKERAVGHSIFPDMIDAIVKLFQGLPARLMSPLQQVLMVIETYGQAMATWWNFYITSMRTDIRLFINDLYAAMAALTQYTGAAAIGLSPAHGGGGVQQYQMGGMVDKLEYALVHPGELILTYAQQKNVAMAIAQPTGYGAGAITVSVDQSGWHVGIDGLPTLGEVKRIVKDGVYGGIVEIFQGAEA